MATTTSNVSTQLIANTSNSQPIVPVNHGNANSQLSPFSLQPFSLETQDNNVSSVDGLYVLDASEINNTEIEEQNQDDNGVNGNGNDIENNIDNEENNSEISNEAFHLPITAPTQIVNNQISQEELLRSQLLAEQRMTLYYQELVNTLRMSETRLLESERRKSQVIRRLRQSVAAKDERITQLNNNITTLNTNVTSLTTTNQTKDTTITNLRNAAEVDNLEKITLRIERDAFAAREQAALSAVNKTQTESDCFQAYPLRPTAAETQVAGPQRSQAQNNAREAKEFADAAQVAKTAALNALNTRDAGPVTPTLLRQFEGWERTASNAKTQAEAKKADSDLNKTAVRTILNQIQHRVTHPGRGR